MLRHSAQAPRQPAEPGRSTRFGAPGCGVSEDGASGSSRVRHQAGAGPPFELIARQRKQRDVVMVAKVYGAAARDTDRNSV